MVRSVPSLRFSCQELQWYLSLLSFSCFALVFEQSRYYSPSQEACRMASLTSSESESWSPGQEEVLHLWLANLFIN